MQETIIKYNKKDVITSATKEVTSTDKIRIDMAAKEPDVARNCQASDNVINYNIDMVEN